MMMTMMNRRAAASYGDVRVETAVTEANGVQLTQMLFDGLLESLDVAEGHMQRKSTAAKSAALARAGRIVLGLQNALDFERGGDIAVNLDELYGYITRRLLHINMNNDFEALREVRGLMRKIRDAWAMVPELLRPARRTM